MSRALILSVGGLTALALSGCRKDPSPLEEAAGYSLARFESCDDMRGYDPCESDYWYAWVRRSVVIEDSLYSLSNYGAKVNALTTPEVEHARVLFYPAQ